MKTDKWRIFAPLTKQQRSLLLSRFYPAFDQVYGFGITYAYGVPKDYSFPNGMLDLVLDGRYFGDGTDTLTGYLQSPSGFLIRKRPDGKLVHLTLSTEPGTPPVMAGVIDPSAIRVCADPLRLPVQLKCVRAALFQPERRLEPSSEMA